MMMMMMMMMMMSCHIASCVQRTPLSVAMVVIMTFIVTDAGSKKFLSANHFSFS
jgi:hypothetical protein